MREEWQFIEDPYQHVLDTNGLLDEKAEGTKRTEKTVRADNKKLSAERKTQVDEATLPSNGEISWSSYAREKEVEEGVSKSNNKSKSNKKQFKRLKKIKLANQVV